MKYKTFYFRLSIHLNALSVRHSVHCTLDDCVDRTNVNGWKIYMHLRLKFEERKKIKVMILYLTSVLTNKPLRH